MVTTIRVIDSINPSFDSKVLAEFDIPDVTDTFALGICRHMITESNYKYGCYAFVNK